MSEPNDNLRHSLPPTARESNTPRRSFLRRLPGYAWRSVIAVAGMCIVILAGLIALPLIPFDRGHR